MALVEEAEEDTDHVLHMIHLKVSQNAKNIDNMLGTALTLRNVEK